VQQQQQASAYSVRNGVERVPTLDPHANPVSEIHGPASRRTPGRDHPAIPGGFAGIRIDVAIERLDERDALT
jgi:hypothetical protein